jgi:hypothetical protein
VTELDDIGAQRREVLAQLNELTEKLRVLAVAEVAAGVPKLQVAKRASITRPTLDIWLRPLP